jgi:hypothetical protein
MGSDSEAHVSQLPFTQLASHSHRENSAIEVGRSITPGVALVVLREGHNILRDGKRIRRCYEIRCPVCPVSTDDFGTDATMN